MDDFGLRKLGSLMLFVIIITLISNRSEIKSKIKGASVFLWRKIKGTSVFLWRKVFMKNKIITSSILIAIGIYLSLLGISDKMNAVKILPGVFLLINGGVILAKGISEYLGG